VLKFVVDSFAAYT